MHCSLMNDSVPITDLRRRSPWSVILIPSSLKIFCADCIRLLSFIWRIVFAGLGQFPKSCPLACRYSRHFSHLPVIRLLSYHQHAIKPYLFNFIICSFIASSEQNCFQMFYYRITSTAGFKKFQFTTP